MFVGVLRLTFHIGHARSLKDKRRVVQKFRDRVRSRFDVSIAEVAAQDLHQRAVFGVGVVSGDAAVCAQSRRKRQAVAADDGHPRARGEIVVHLGAGGTTAVAAALFVPPPP